MIPLNSEERLHLDAFNAARPDWRLAYLNERIFDEMDGSRAHKYPRSHPYITGMQFVLRYLRTMGPCSLLDIGSPLAQNVAAACLPGVEVTVLDVRPHEDADKLGLKWRTACATALPFDDNSWGFVTSLWVMGHVGDGRYGDDLAVEGDRKMLAEIARVLRPGGTAIIGPGLVDEIGGNIFNLHRIYTWQWLLEEFERVGLELAEHRDLPVSSEVFIGADGKSIERRDGAYALAVVTKPR